MITPQQIVDLLNDLARLDARALALLIEKRVCCNQALADHPTVPVTGGVADSPAFVGVLGLLNGITRLADRTVEAVYTSADDPLSLTGFKLRDKPWSEEASGG